MEQPEAPQKPAEVASPGESLEQKQDKAPSTTTSPPITPAEASNGATSTATTPKTENKPVRPGAQPQKKPTLSSRLSGMFSRKDANDAQQAKEKLGDRVPETAIAEEGEDHATSLPERPGRPSRTSSKTNGTARKGSDTPKEKRDESQAATAPKRFWIDEAGEHHHFLKNAKRQEKLSGLVRDFLGGKKKEHQEEQPLSLMQGWVDQIKSERSKLAGDKTAGPNHSATLVEKYGKCQEVIGRGAFGIVRIAHKPDPADSKHEQLYAVKEFRRRPNEDGKKYSKRLNSEFCISSSLRHPNVIHTLDLLTDAKGDYCEVMEFCAGGDLYSLVLAAGKLDCVEADCYFLQLMRGVEYIHEMGVAHRDLKPENLLLTNHGALKITDFGNGECFRMAWETEPHMTAGLCGSAPYIAPEEYVEKEFDPRAVDVWACGVIYMAMRSGRHLWRIAKKGEDEFYDNYLVGRKSEEGYPPIEAMHRARCRNVIYSILDPAASRRLSAHQVLNSEWGKSIKLCTAGGEGL